MAIQPADCPCRCGPEAGALARRYSDSDITTQIVTGPLQFFCSRDAWLTGPRREGEKTRGPASEPLKIDAYSIQITEELGSRHELPEPATAARHRV